MKAVNLFFPISFFIISMMTSSAYAYSWMKCNSGSGVGRVVSSAQFTSSWGPCSMFGMMKRDQDKMFIVHNLDKMIIDSSRGSGEYLQAYAMASGCEKTTINHFERQTKTNFEGIYGKDAAHSPQEVYESLSRLIVKDPVLRAGCKNFSI